MIKCKQRKKSLKEINLKIWFLRNKIKIILTKKQLNLTRTLLFVQMSLKSRTREKKRQRVRFWTKIVMKILTKKIQILAAKQSRNNLNKKRMNRKTLLKWRHKSSKTNLIRPDKPTRNFYRNLMRLLSLRDAKIRPKVQKGSKKPKII